MAMNILEINLISAQGLNWPSNMRRMQTYALVWVDSSTKLRTQVDRLGADNPTWNDKFLFKVTPEFLSSDTSGISVEIYATGYFRDHLLGTVRFLVSTIPLAVGMKTPSFTAIQIRRPSGRIKGALNVAAMLIEGSDFAALSGISAIGYRDLMGEIARDRHSGKWVRKSKSMADNLDAIDGGSESWENSSSVQSPGSDGGDSTTSSSSTTSTVLKDWNGISNLAGKHHWRSASTGMLCGLLTDRKNRSNPSHEDC